MGVVRDYYGKVIGWRGPDGNMYSSESQYKAQIRENEGRGGKIHHKGAVNDRGIRIGDLERVDRGDGKGGFLARGARTSVTGPGYFGMAPITLAGTKLYPMLKGDDVLYVQRGFKPGEKPAPKTEPEPPKEPIEEAPVEETPIEPKTPPTPEAPTGRDAPPPTENPNDIPQKGTIMGRSSLSMEDANKLLPDGYTVGNPFASTQLPATSANPYFNNSLDIDYSRKLSEDMFSDIPLNLTSNAFDAGSGVEYGKTIPQYPASGVIDWKRTAGSTPIVSPGTLKVTEPNEAAQEPEINKIPPKPRGGRQLQNWENRYERKVRAAEMAAEREKSELEKNFKPDKERNKAFLDDDLNTFQALRAVEAQKGVVYHKGQYHLSNPNAGEEGEPDFFIGTKEDRDIRLRGERTAQEFLDSRVKDITKSTNKTDEEEDNK